MSLVTEMYDEGYDDGVMSLSKRIAEILSTDGLSDTDKLNQIKELESIKPLLNK